MIELSYVVYYLLIVNAISFFLTAINGALRKKSSFNIEVLLMICAFLGGSLGILISAIIFDRKIEKENILTRICAVCMLVIHTILILFMFVMPKGSLNFDIMGFLSGNMWLVIYLAVINAVTFAIFGIDKYNAIKQRDRISIVTLILFSFLGGAVGGLIAMYLFRHKTQKSYFVVGVPLIILMQAAVVFLLMNII